MLAHCFYPPRIDHSSTEYPARFFVEGAGFDGFLAGGVADVGFGVFSGECADGGDHAAVELEVVVGVGDVVFFGVDVFGGDLDAFVGGAHVVGGFDAVEVAAVGVAAPGGVDLGEVLVVAPVAGFDELEESGAVGSGFGAEDAADVVVGVGGIGFGVGFDVVVFVGFVEVGYELDGVVEEGEDVWEGVAEEAGDADGGVDAGAAEFFEADDFEVDDAAGGFVPDGSDAEEGEDFGDVVAGGAHGGGAPDGEADGFGVVSVFFLVAVDEGVCEELAGFPGESGWEGFGVDGVEVSSGG